MNDPNVEAFIKAKRPYMAFGSMLVKRLPTLILAVGLVANPTIPERTVTTLVKLVR